MSKSATPLSYHRFLETLPPVLVPLLPPRLQQVKTNRPWRWLIQFHFGEPRLHYEVVRTRNGRGLEVGFHFESSDRLLNRFLLDGFRRHLFEIKDTLGKSVEAEMWDKGWTKIYEVYPEKPLTPAYQAEVAQRLAGMMTCLQPIFIELRAAVAQVYR
jgi:hypothetical protein